MEALGKTGFSVNINNIFKVLFLTLCSNSLEWSVAVVLLRGLEEFFLPSSCPPSFLRTYLPFGIEAEGAPCTVFTQRLWSMAHVTCTTEVSGCL